MEETQARGLPSSSLKVDGIDDFEEIPQMLIWIFGTKSMECTSVLHQPDGVGLQGRSLGLVGKLNGVPIALMAWSLVFTVETDKDLERS